MKFQKINTSVLRELLKLTERKENLLLELTKIESLITSLLKKQPLAEITPTEKALQQAARGSAKNNRSSMDKRAPRGTMQKKILEALAEAGPLGMKIPDLSKKINVKSANIHVWFTNVGKKLPEIERIGAGHFRLKHS
ncbi:MAG: hypothetical protein ACH346_04995 [Chthoniobacterales bacterium]